MAGGEQQIELVRGPRDAVLIEHLIAFWEEHGGLTGSAARSRLDEVLCARRDAGGRIVAVNSAYPATAPLVGRRFWMYRSLQTPEADSEAEMEMIEAARAELAAHFTGGRGEPLGLCVVVSDRVLMERYPEAVWSSSGLLFAGYTEHGEQVRISYFEGAQLDP